ncbi:hypothetical protein [Streptomyces sp. AC550_RSS872]|uniref:hypothetical protein n=1 Tax=Streptomyces sp. AC550_RSS872 TaxID=2823689 RepID=UPI0035AB8413
MAERLGSDAVRAVGLLRPLAFAEGQGLPWEDLWAPLASALSGRTYTDDDIMWLRHAAGAYVVEATESGHSAYRLYHEALAEHLRADVDATEAHARITRALVARVPRALDGGRDWSRAHPYTRRYLAAHAVRGEVLDVVVTEAEFLVHADPDELMSHLREVRSGPAYRAGEIYRASFGAHRREDPNERRRILALGWPRNCRSPSTCPARSPTSFPRPSPPTSREPRRARNRPTGSVARLLTGPARTPTATAARYSPR